MSRVSFVSAKFEGEKYGHEYGQHGSGANLLAVDAIESDGSRKWWAVPKTQITGIEDDFGDVGPVFGYPAQLYGKVITDAWQNENAIGLTFEDGTSMRLFDDERKCCEQRFLHSDDEFLDIVGGCLLKIVAKDGPGCEVKDSPSSVSDHHDELYGDSLFVDILTDKGFVTVTAYNFHNGYYEGFRPTVKFSR